MNTSEPTAIVLLSRYEYTNKSTFASSFSTKHRNLNSLFHIFKNIPRYRYFRKKPRDPDSDFLDNNLRILIPSHIKKHWQRFHHFRLWNTFDNPIVLDSNPIQGMSKSLVESKNHLSCQMVNPIERRVIQFQFILCIAIVWFTFYLGQFISKKAFFF